MRNIESSNKSGWAKKTMAATAIVGAAAWVGAGTGINIGKSNGNI